MINDIPKRDTNIFRDAMRNYLPRSKALGNEIRETVETPSLSHHDFEEEEYYIFIRVITRDMLQ